MLVTLPQILYLILFGLLLGSLGIGIIYFKYYRSSQRQLQQNWRELCELKQQYQQQQEEKQRLFSQKKSSETRWGQFAEKFFPLLPACPYSPREMHFLGQPVDFVVFNSLAQEVVLLEIKAGKGRLSPKQQLIRQWVQEKRVRYEELHLDPQYPGLIGQRQKGGLADAADEDI